MNFGFNLCDPCYPWSAFFEEAVAAKRRAILSMSTRMSCLMSTEEIIKEAQALSPGEQALVVDSLLHSLHQPDPNVEGAWLDLARARLAELDSGDVSSVPGSEVLARLRDRFPAN